MQFFTRTLITTFSSVRSRLGKRHEFIYLMMHFNLRLNRSPGLWSLVPISKFALCVYIYMCLSEGVFLSCLSCPPTFPSCFHTRWDLFTERETWTKVPARGELPEPRVAASLVAVDKQLYLWGGLNSDLGWPEGLHVFDIGTESADDLFYSHLFLKG